MTSRHKRKAKLDEPLKIIIAMEGNVDEIDVLWLVIDTDRWGDKQLSEVTSECVSKHFRLAVSNPCFELWLILHYEDSDSISKTAKCSELKA
jgi:hypothetical protein